MADTAAQASAGNDWNAGLYDGKHSFVWKEGASLLEFLAPQPGERILDLGCGTGHLTAQIAQAGAEVVGIDSAPSMVDEARRLYPRLHFELADARSFSFAERFDAVFSNAVLHWIREPVLVIDRLWQALKPGGRFVAEFGGRGNVAAIAGALGKVFEALEFRPLELPWYFPSVGEYASLLEQRGLEVTYATLFDRPSPLEGEEGMRHWIEMFASEPLAQVAPPRRGDFLTEVEKELRPALYREGNWFADYRRLRVVARRWDERVLATSGLAC